MVTSSYATADKTGSPSLDKGRQLHPIIGIDRDPTSGDDLDYLIEATCGGTPAGPVRVPAEEARAISVAQVHIWCAEFT